MVKGIEGNREVTELILQNKDGRESKLAVQGVFILVGITPNNEMLPADQLKMEDGFILTDREMRTNLPGVMAAGDIISKNINTFGLEPFVIGRCNRLSILSQFFIFFHTRPPYIFKE